MSDEAYEAMKAAILIALQKCLIADQKARIRDLEYQVRCLCETK
jgi:hypothetical protein